MTIQTLRPNGVNQVGSFSPVGAASLNAATSDNSDATYAQSTTTLNYAMSLLMSSYTLLSNQRVKLTRLRVRANSSVGQSSFGALHSTNNLFWGTLFTQSVTSVITTYSSSWMTPPTEVTQALIDDLRLSAMAQYTDGTSLLRVEELYLDLDVRARPVINSFSASVTGDTATFSLTFTYGTSAISETVTIRVDIYDEDGVLVDSTSTTATGADFATTPISLNYSAAFGTYTAVATVVASGFVAPNITFESATSQAVYTILPAGVEPPILDCSSDQAAQTVTLDISQNDNVIPPSVNCLRIETLGTGPFGNQATLPGSGGSGVFTVDKAALDLTGDITIRCWVRATDWTPAAQQVILAKGSLTNAGGYGLLVGTTGLLTFWIETGSATRQMVSTAPGFTDGQGYWLDIYYNNTAKTTTFRKSSDPLMTAGVNITWTTISTSAAHAGGSPVAGTQDLYLGRLPSGTLPLVGAIGYMTLINGVFGVGSSIAEADFRFRKPGLASFVDGSSNTWTVSGGAAIAINSATVTTVGQPRHASLYINDTLTTADLVFGATSVTIAGSTENVIPVNSSTPQIVVATTGGGAANTVLNAYQISGPGIVTHNLGTRNLIIQARDTVTGLQTELGVALNPNLNEFFVTGPFSQNLTVLVLAQVAAGAVCVPNTTGAILANTQNQVVTHQYSSRLTLATFVRTSDNRVSWVGIELDVGRIVVDNDGGAGTVNVSGRLVVFDDPDAVRAEVRRDGELIPLDGLNGALVPPFGEGSLVVVDRFPERFAVPTCEDDVNPTGPTYEVRFYGYVDGLVGYSPWAECTPPAILHNGRALLRDPFDETLDIDGCVSTENFQRSRPWGSQQPTSGGLPVVRINDTGGRDFSIVVEAPNTESALAVDALFQGTYIWYSPLDVGLPNLWAVLGQATPFSGYKNDARPWSISQALTETEPEPIVLPPPGPPSS